MLPMSNPVQSVLLFVVVVPISLDCFSGGLADRLPCGIAGDRLGPLEELEAPPFCAVAGSSNLYLNRSSNLFLHLILCSFHSESFSMASHPGHFGVGPCSMMSFFSIVIASSISPSDSVPSPESGSCPFGLIAGLVFSKSFAYLSPAFAPIVG